MSRWKSTKIYLALDKEDKYSRSMISLLENAEVMDKIENILDLNATTPKDFTLHNSDHSFRVAEGIWEIIPDETKLILSPYEKGFLLLSAYLHDIGMSPDFDKVERHLKYLTTDEKHVLNDIEVQEFQKWIDNDEKAIRIDIRKEKINEINDSNYILTYYIRHKHNDWSGLWIKENLSNVKLFNYDNWASDLIKICKSHHFGIDKLLSGEFDPIPIGDIVVHLRYLSMCLRISDILENDPERTPDVILKHRGITESSRKYWIKDHQYNIRRNGNKFTIFSRPDRAYLHNAIEYTANDVENELKLCWQLSTEKPLNVSIFKNLKNYTWDLEPTLTRDIKPNDGAYEYIQGAFRPKTTKILELLGGSQLYGNAKWALRELLQNAFDAVKEKISYEVIERNDDPDKLAETFGKLNDIHLELIKKTDGYWLICKDSGVGMTKNIIESYFLESGASKRHEIIELERKCKAKNYNFGRTGQFGIGVLSYFMLAEKIVVYTKREQNTGYDDRDSVAWRFEINGSHDFGELTRIKHSISGTDIQMKLNKEIVDNIDDWDLLFKNFLKNNLIKTPCPITYKSSINSNNITKILTGWTNSSSDIKEKLISFMEEKMVKNNKEENEIISLKKEKEIILNNTRIQSALSEMSGIMDFLFAEGDLLGQGKYRIHIPYFKLSKGNSFYYLREEIDEYNHKILQINSGNYVRNDFNKMFFSLKGFGVNLSNTNKEDAYLLKPYIENAYIEIDFESIIESNLTISRHYLYFEDTFKHIKIFIDEKVKELIASNSKIFINSYNSINRDITKNIIELNDENWAFPVKKENYNDEESELIWKKIEFPIIETTFRSRSEKPLHYQKNTLTKIDSLTLYYTRNYRNWFNENVNNCRLGILINNSYFGKSYLSVATTENSTKFNEKFIIKKIELPKEWDKVLLFTNVSMFDELHNYFININYKYINLYNPIIFEEFIDRNDTFEISDLTTKEHCFAFLLLSIIKFQKDKWIGLCEKKEKIMNFAFAKLKIKNFYILQVNDELIKISLNGYDTPTIEEKTKILNEGIDSSYFIEPTID